MLCRRLDPRAELPARAIDGDAGYDLRALDAGYIPVGGYAAIDTGVAIELSARVAALVVPLSGLAAKTGVTVLNAPGLIDPSYRGSIKAILVNHGRLTFTYEPGDRIAQLLLVPFFAPGLAFSDELSETERAAHGLGSTGVK